MLPEEKSETPTQLMLVQEHLPVDEPPEYTSEISRYLNSIATFGTIPDNLLEFWKSKRKEFPSLAKLARKYLPVPPGTVCAEESFSELHFLINEKRSNLTANSVHDMFVTRSLLKYVEKT